MSIVKTFFGTHLDLSKVVQISDASGWRDGSDYRVGFSIDVQLRDEPIRYSKVADESAVAELQSEVDALVAHWKALSSPVAAKPEQEAKSASSTR